MQNTNKNEMCKDECRLRYPLSKNWCDQCRDEKESWEIEFDKKVNELRCANEETEEITEFGYRYKGQGGFIHSATDWGHVKKFVRSTLSNQRSEIVEKIISLVVNTPEQVQELNKDLPSTIQIHAYHQAKGYGDAIGDVINLLNSKEEEKCDHQWESFTGPFRAFEACVKCHTEKES